MANNANPLAGNMISQEPHFYGQNSKEGLPINEFITRMNTLHAAVGDTVVEQTSFASRAVNFLHGEAHVWFHKNLQFNFPEAQVAALTAWPQLRMQLQKYYSVVTESADVSVNWGSLKQGEHESAMQFHGRVSVTLQEYLNVAPAMDAPPDADPMFELIMEQRNAHVALLNNPTPQAINQVNMLYRAGLLQTMRSTASKMRRILIADIAIKTLGDGLSSSRIREMVRKEERRHTSFAEIGDKLRTLQATMNDVRGSKTATNVKNNKVGEVQAADNESSDSEDDSSAAIRKKKNHNKKSKKQTSNGNNGNNGNKKKQSSEVKDPTGSSAKITCTFCDGEGHTEDKCRARTYHKRQAVKYRKEKAEEYLKKTGQTSGIQEDSKKTPSTKEVCEAHKRFGEEFGKWDRQGRQFQGNANAGM